MASSRIAPLRAFGPRLPASSPVPPLPFLTTSAACSALALAGLLHPAADHGVRLVAGLRPGSSRDASRSCCLGPSPDPGGSVFPRGVDLAAADRVGDSVAGVFGGRRPCRRRCSPSRPRGIHTSCAVSATRAHNRRRCYEPTRRWPAAAPVPTIARQAGRRDVAIPTATTGVDRLPAPWWSLRPAADGEPSTADEVTGTGRPTFVIATLPPPHEVGSDPPALACLRAVLSGAVPFEAFPSSTARSPSHDAAPIPLERVRVVPSLRLSPAHQVTLAAASVPFPPVPARLRAGPEVTPELSLGRGLLPCPSPLPKRQFGPGRSRVPGVLTDRLRGRSARCSLGLGLAASVFLVTCRPVNREGSGSSEAEAVVVSFARGQAVRLHDAGCPRDVRPEGWASRGRLAPGFPRVPCSSGSCCFGAACCAASSRELQPASCSAAADPASPVGVHLSVSAVR
jgi:hypothetical protein